MTRITIGLVRLTWEENRQNYDSPDEADKTPGNGQNRCPMLHQRPEPHLSPEIHNSKTHALLPINANRHIFMVLKAIVFFFIEGVFLNDEKDLIPINVVSPQFKRILPMLIEKINGLI